MQSKFLDRAPHLIHEYNGQTGDFLVCEGLHPFNPTSLGNAGIPPEEHEKFSHGGYAVCRPAYRRYTTGRKVSVRIANSV